MKIRSRFVSNSSTSSFLIYGISFENEDVWNEAIKDTEAYRASKLSLEYGNPNYDNTVYIGRNPTEMKDEQTMKTWKAEICDSLSKILGREITEKECGWHEDCYYDG